MANHLLEETEKQMNFLNSIFNMMSSSFWDSPESEESDEFEDHGKLTLIPVKNWSVLSVINFNANRVCQESCSVPTH